MAFPIHIDPTERRIINKMVKDALAAGHSISVFDGEEWPVKRGTDYGKITAEIAATDETTLRFVTREGAVVGSVLLVHGNGAEVISDHSANPEIEALIAGAVAIAEAADQ